MVVTAISAASWLLPIYRVVEYLMSLPSLMSGKSIGDSNDLHYGYELLFSYLFCLLTPVLLGYLYILRPKLLVIVPCLLVVAMALRVIALRPEEVIVLFPSIRPFQPAQVGLVAALVGLYFFQSNSRPEFDQS